MSDLVTTVMGICCVVALFFIGFGMGIQDGYENAYRMMKQGTLEQHMKKHYPKTWVEFNELNKPGETK